jgi:2-polyprenyl-3-methyl-5-hydroxy-6-metoxy-1,4-benzoquinol methylase
MTAVEPVVSTALTETDRAVFDQLLALEGVLTRYYEWTYDVIAPWLGGSLMEVGSGNGMMSRYLVARGQPIVLTDCHPAYLLRLRAQYGALRQVSFQLLDLRQPPAIAPPGLDTVVCLNVLEHLEDDHAGVRALAAMLPAGGRLVIQVPNYPFLHGSLDTAFGHVRRYTRPTLSAALSAGGFRIVSMRNFNPLAIPGWLVASKVQRARRVNIRAARLFNRIVPLARRLDVLSRFAGLALIACAERRDTQLT